MEKTRNLTAVQTSAGRGKRCMPLNLYSPTSMIPKGLMRVMGLPISEIQLEQFKAGGIKDVYVITQFLENREHLSNRFGNGSRFGLTMHYSDPSNDKRDNGSGGAILANMEKRNLKGDSIWLPNDNLFEFDLDRVVQSHIESRAAVSIMTISAKPRDVIKTYGLIDADVNRRVLKLLEKPEDENHIMELLHITNIDELDSRKVTINTAGYIINNDILSEVLKEAWLIETRERLGPNFDMAGSLIPKLMEHNYPVHIIPIDAWGDFGSTSFFLDTFPDALRGKFYTIYTILEKAGYYRNASSNVWIHPGSINKIDRKGKTLKERIDEGSVKIGPNVFIGRGATIEDGAKIRHSDIEKYAVIGKNAELDFAYLSPYCEIGSHTTLRECALGLQVRVDSSKEFPTFINGRTVIGPEIHIPEGTILNNAKIFPGYHFKEKNEIHNYEKLEPTVEEILAIVNNYV